MAKRGRKQSPPAAPRPTRGSPAVLLGMLLLLGAFMLLTTTPEVMYQAWHRDGYERTDAELLSPSGRSRSVRVRIGSSGAELSVRRTTFDTRSEHARVPVWYNPEAIVSAGITWLDVRVVSAERQPELPTSNQATMMLLLNLLLFAGGGLLLLASMRRVR